MKKSPCEVTINYEVDELRSTYIITCVFNGFLCYNVVMLNIVTIIAIRRTSSLPNTLKILLLNLAFSDVGVGSLGQPFYISLVVNWLQGKNTCYTTFIVFNTTMILFPIASFLGVVAVSVDRFLAIQFHLRYQELVTHKRVVAVVISIWLWSVSFSLMTLWVSDYIKDIFLCVGGVACLLVTSMAYLKIYLVVRRHKNQIQVLQVRQVTQASEVQSFTSLRKSAVGIFYVYIVFLICYLPFLVSVAMVRTVNSPSITLLRFFNFSCTLIFLNSSLNPVIYCWKMKHIRHAVMVILRSFHFRRNGRILINRRTSVARSVLSGPRTV